MKIETRKVLLLGGTGTLSSSVLTDSLNNGFDVTILNRGLRKSLIPSTIEHIKCDFHDKEHLANAIGEKSFDVIVDFLSRQENDIERVYPILSRHCKQYIFISSACVYRREARDFPIKEDSPKPNKDWSYNVEKFECEKRLIELASKSDNIYTIVRPYITYDNERIPLGIAPVYRFHRTLLERFKNGKPWFVLDDGEAITTITSVKDFSKALVGLFNNPKAYNEDFHITGDCRYTQYDLAKMLFLKFNRKPRIISIPAEVFANNFPEYKGMINGDRKLNAIFSNDKIKEAVPGLTINTSFEDAFNDIIDYYENLCEFEYDYLFEAKIDRFISQYTPGCHLKIYPNSKCNDIRKYLILRYAPYRLQNKLLSLLKVK